MTLILGLIGGALIGATLTVTAIVFWIERYVRFPWE